MMYQRTFSFRAVAFAAFLFGWALVLASLAKPAAAEPERYNTWQDMCQEHACADFPMDHLTASFGGQYYYIPMRRLTFPDWQTIDPKEEPFEIMRYNLSETPDMPRRAFSNLGFTLTNCCNELFRWFGMSEIGGKNASSNSISVHPYISQPLYADGDELYSLRSRVYGEQAETLPEIDPPQIPVELRTDYSPSFWRLAYLHDDMVLVSKRPILAESYVMMICRSILCDIETLRPADGTKNPPLFVRLWLWSPTLEYDGAEKIAAFIAAVDELLRVARVNPEER